MSLKEALNPVLWVRKLQSWTDPGWFFSYYRPWLQQLRTWWEMAGLCVALQSYRAGSDTAGCDSGREQSCYSSVSSSDIKPIYDLSHTQISLFVFQMKMHSKNNITVHIKSHYSHSSTVAFYDQRKQGHSQFRTWLEFCSFVRFSELTTEEYKWWRLSWSPSLLLTDTLHNLYFYMSLQHFKVFLLLPSPALNPHVQS